MFSFFFIKNINIKNYFQIILQKLIQWITIPIIEIISQGNTII